MNSENQPTPHPSVNVQSLTPGGLPAQSPPSARAANHLVNPDPSSMIELSSSQHEAESPPTPRGSILTDYWRKIGGGSLALSLLIHGGLIAIFIMVVYSTSVRPPDSELIITGHNKGKSAATEHSVQASDKKLSNMAKAASMAKIISTGKSFINLPPEHLETLDFPIIPTINGGLLGSNGPIIPGGKIGTGPPSPGDPRNANPLPTFFTSRCEKFKRLEKLKANGGTLECEKAVSVALEYLKSKQNPDGSWGTTNKGAMTGFALLCYLGRCETPESIYYGDNVTKGILYLIELSKKNPEGLIAEKIAGNSVPYEHGIATYALGEMYSLARLGSKPMPGMREAFENGVKAIIKYQHPDGSWVYGNGSYAESGREDLSVTGWQYQALKSAKLSGLKIDKLHSAIDSTIKYLQSKQTADGGFGTTNREGSYNQWNLTGVGVLGLQTLGKGHSSEIKKGIKFSHAIFTQSTPEWSSANLYAWYYYAQAFFQNGGPEWKQWNESAMPAILANQNKDGSWTPNLKPAQGGIAGGDGIYSTALCTLMLEVYYRYLQVGPNNMPQVFHQID